MRFFLKTTIPLLFLSVVFLFYFAFSEHGKVSDRNNQIDLPDRFVQPELYPANPLWKLRLGKTEKKTVGTAVPPVGFPDEILLEKPLGRVPFQTGLTGRKKKEVYPARAGPSPL